MVKKQDFISALNETMKSHFLTLKDIKKWFYISIMEEVDITSFTRQNGAREKVVGISSDDFLAFILSGVIDYYYAVSDTEKEECKDLIQIMKMKEINSSFYFKTHSESLLRAIDIAIRSAYYLDIAPDYLTEEQAFLLNKIFQDIKEACDVKEIEVNYRAINQCILDILDGSQLKNRKSN